MLCRLYSWNKNRFMIGHHSTAAVPGLAVSDVNFNFSSFVHNHGFCFLQVWCPTVFVSSGHRVLLNVGLWDTLFYYVLKKLHWKVRLKPEHQKNGIWPWGLQQNKRKNRSTRNVRNHKEVDSFRLFLVASYSHLFHRPYLVAWHCHDLPCLNELSSAVLHCFTLSLARPAEQKCYKVE